MLLCSSAAWAQQDSQTPPHPASAKPPSAVGNPQEMFGKEPFVVDVIGPAAVAAGATAPAAKSVAPNAAPTVVPSTAEPAAAPEITLSSEVTAPESAGVAVPSSPVEREKVRSAIHSYCASVSSGDLSLLGPVCEFALASSLTLPDFICNQKTIRYVPPAATGFGPQAQQASVITAQVTFESATQHEQYGEIKANGKPTSLGMLQLGGMSSRGEFGSQLLRIFQPRAHARLKFQKTAKVKGEARRVFDFEIAAENSFWCFADFGKQVCPGYHGELWVSELDAQLRHMVLRYERKINQAPWTKSVDEVTLKTEYAPVQLGEAGTFALPAHSEIVGCLRGRCWRNISDFTDCHKFAGKATIVAPEQP